VAYQLTPGEAVGGALRRCADEQLRRAIQALEEEVDSDPVTAIHTARKAIKKERALLRLARGAIAPSTRSSENAHLRAAAGRLSGLRDAEVMLLTLDTLLRRDPGRVPEAALASLRAQLERERDAERGSPAVVGEVAGELRRARRRLAAWEPSADGWGALAPGLERTYRSGRRLMRRARRDPSPANLHEWRKRVKDLWYEMRLLAPVCGPIVGGAGAEAGELGEVLGEDHDLSVLRAKVEGVEALTAVIDERRAELQARAFALGSRLYAESPRAFHQRLARYWRA